MAMEARYIGVRAAAERHRASISTVQIWYAVLENGGSFESQPRSGRPVTITKAVSRRIVKFVKKNTENRRLTPKKAVHALEDIDINISETAYRKVMKANDLRRYKVKKKPTLNEEQRLSRLIYAQLAYRIEPDHIIFTDEKPIRLQVSSDQYVTRTPDEYLEDFNFSPAFRSVPTIQAWGAVWVGGRSELVRFDCSQSEGARGGVTSAIFREQAFNNQLLPIWHRLRGHRHFMWIVQDGATIHWTQAIHDAGKEAKMNFLDHPANSPDLNPIEHVWGMLDQEIDKAILGKNPPRNVEQLWTVAEAAWWRIPQEKIDGAILT